MENIFAVKNHVLVFFPKQQVDFLCLANLYRIYKEFIAHWNLSGRLFDGFSAAGWPRRTCGKSSSSAASFCRTQNCGDYPATASF